MIYRCRKCEREVGFGCLPQVACGLYLFFLMGLFGAGFGVLGLLLRWFVEWKFGPPPPPQNDPPWWVFAIVGVLALPLTLFGAVALDWAFRQIEGLFLFRQPCPDCGARNWSKGFTRGFGL